MHSRYLGSSAVLSSEANQEVVPASPEGWTNVSYRFQNFSFINYDPCTVIINGSAPIYLKEEQGFESGQGNQPIESFVIVESDIQYSWIGAY